MIYVLLMIIASSSNNTAVHTQELASKEKCEIVLNTIVQSKLLRGWNFNDYYDRSVLLCVEK